MRTSLWMVVAVALVLPGLARPQRWVYSAEVRGADVVNGKPLNALLGRLREPVKKALPDPDPVIEAGVLRRVHVASGPLTVSIALLRDPTRLAWPEALDEDVTALDRQQVADRLAEAVALLRKGKPVDAPLKALSPPLARLNKHLTDKVAELTPVQYITAKRLLNIIRDASEQLRKPGTRLDLELNDKLASKGRTVPELVRFLVENKLSFAPGLPADEEAYLRVHEAMRAYAERVGR